MSSVSAAVNARLERAREADDAGGGLPEGASAAVASSVGAPYFTALVASSCIPIPRATAALGVKRTSLK